MMVMLSVRSGWILPAAATLFAASLTMSASARQSKPGDAEKLPPALAKPVGELTTEEETQFSNAAEQTIERVCVACHPFENIIKTRRLPKDWADQVTIMAQRGAPGTESDFSLVRKYLIRYYGIVRVNTATAEELSMVLGLPMKTATAIVEYRTANGRFTDLASLAKVDGVDKAKIEEQPEALRFD
jgi:competence ComEA-like helix-hairpin-helix protein